MKEHTSYLGTVTVGGSIYIGHLYQHEDVGPDAYSVQFRMVTAEGNQTAATMRGQWASRELAVTWGVLVMLEYMLSVGIAIEDIVTIHPATDPGLDMETLCDAIAAHVVAIEAEGSAATKH